MSAAVGPDVGAAQDDHSLMRRVAARDPNALRALYDYKMRDRLSEKGALT